MSAFSALFAGLLRDRELTHREFARLPSVGVSAGFVSQCASGHSKPPLDRVEGWADALGLSEGSNEWAHFIWLAKLTHSPDEIERTFSNIPAEHLADLKPGESRAVEVALLQPHVQARVRTFAAIEERRVSDDQLRAALREQVEIRQAQAIHLKHAIQRADRAEAELAALRAQLAALATTPPRPGLTALRNALHEQPQPQTATS